MTSNKNLAIGGIIIIFLIVVIFTSFIPNLEDKKSTNKTVTVQQNIGDSNVINSRLEAELVNETGQGIFIEINNKDAGVVKLTNALKEGDSDIIKFSKGNISVKYKSKLEDSFLIEYESGRFFNWPKGVIILMKNINSILLITFIFLLILVGFLVWGDI